LFKDQIIIAGASTLYKRCSKFTREKVRGEVFAAFFRNLEEDKFINFSINFLCKLIIYRTGIVQHKDVSFAEEINALPHPL